MAYKVSILIEHNAHDYHAYCPDLKGCQSQADSYDEAMSDIKEAIELYLEADEIHPSHKADR